jgi:hypothetical protein
MEGGFIPWDALAEAVLDPPLRPLVAALNRTSWVRTVFSCAGHPEEPDSVRRGRRQAHLDVLVADPARWRAFVRRVQRDAPAAVERLGLAEGMPSSAMTRADSEKPAATGGLDLPGRGEGIVGDLAGGPARVRCAEGSLGPLPDWLRAALAASSSGMRPTGRAWHYRRLVLEPVPYPLAPDVCRRVLDTALAATLGALD